MLAILVLIVVAVGLNSTSWYSQTESAFGITFDIDYGLYEAEGSYGMTTVKVKYDDVESQSTVSTVVVHTAERTRGIIFLGFFLLAVFTLMAFVAALGRGGTFLRKATPAIGFMAGLVLLAASIYFAINFPDAIEEESGSEASGSLGSSLYGLLFGSLLLLLGAEISRRAPSDEEMDMLDPYYYQP